MVLDSSRLALEEKIKGMGNWWFEQSRLCFWEIRSGWSSGTICGAQRALCRYYPQYRWLADTVVHRMLWSAYAANGYFRATIAKGLGSALKIME